MDVTRYFWIKSNGQIKELTWEQYREMLVAQFRRHRNLLIKLERSHITATHGEDTIIIPLKQLLQILNCKPPQPKLKSNAAPLLEDLR